MAQISYAYGITSVKTTAAEALAGKQGVCQDSAHIMLAICRACNLPARYVSGHLLGEGGTHAWVEVLLPHPDGEGYVAWPFDPTHGNEPGLNYITIAVGPRLRRCRPDLRHLPRAAWWSPLDAQAGRSDGGGVFRRRLNWAVLSPSDMFALLTTASPDLARRFSFLLSRAGCLRLAVGLADALAVARSGRWRAGRTVVAATVGVGVGRGVAVGAIVGLAGIRSITTRTCCAGSALSSSGFVIVGVRS